MARFPKAVWHGPLPYTDYATIEQAGHRGLVLHIIEGSIESCNNWFHDPAASVSAHFGNPKTGPLYQWVDTSERAYAEMSGNDSWVSLENEGFAPEQLNDNQLANAAELLAWLHTTEGVQLALADSPKGYGLGYHAMGGVPWGNHPGCPGVEIIAQREQIIERAKALLAPKAPPRFLIVVHPHNNGLALVDLEMREWQGIPNTLDERVLVTRGIARGSVPPLWWTSAEQLAWGSPWKERVGA